MQGQHLISKFAVHAVRLQSAGHTPFVNSTGYSCLKCEGEQVDGYVPCNLHDTVKNTKHGFKDKGKDIEASMAATH